MAAPLPTPPAQGIAPAAAAQMPSGGEETLHQKRTKIVQELKQTEATYISALEALVNHYQHNLLSWAETEQLPNITKAQIRQIFLNAEQILPINTHLYEGVCLRIENWGPNQKIADIFMKMVPYFKLYTVFATSYEKADAMLTKCQQNERFVQLCQHISKSTTSKVGKLENLLIQPMQRIPRYQLLLADLLSKTAPEHPDHNDLKGSISLLNNIMEFLDSSITKNENMRAMLSLNGRVKGAGRLIQPHRKLIAEGILSLRSKETSGAQATLKKKFGSSKLTKESKLQVWLFNDVMVHLKSNKSKRTNVASTEYTWPLQLVWLKDNKETDTNDTKMPYSFMLVGPGKVYTARFADITEKRSWYKRIEEAVAQVLTEENAPDDVHRYSHYRFPNGGGDYEGWWRFGRIHGEGVFKFFGNKYSGEWEYNRKHGTGTFELVTGEVYQGEWVDDMPNGYGIVTYVNRDRYEGYWKDGMRNSKGVMYYITGDKYDGEWTMNVFSGEGTYTTTTGYIYKGAWAGGKLHGHGVLVAPNGRQYEGEFRNGMKNGEGKLDYANGDFYIGQWKDDRRHGYGVFHSAVEGIFEGYWVNGMREGQGKMSFRTGDVYEGNWKRDLFHGQGVLVCAAGGMDKYDGNWEAGKHQGKGTLFYKSGARFEGLFKDDKPNGNGIFISTNAVVFDGKWLEGRREGKATLSVGPSKFPGTCMNGTMAEGVHSFMIIPECPVIHLNL